MTGDSIMAWQAEMFVLSCLLYDEAEGICDPVLKDEDFDQHCRKLIDWYDKLPEAFRARVSIDRLKAGTTSGMVYTDEERAEARAWLKRARDPLWWKSEDALA